MKYPKSFEDLIDGFARLPGVGYKTAERMAFQVLSMNEEDVKTFANALLNSKTSIHPCPKCGHITEKEECEICSDTLRDHSTICVVATSKDVYALERSKSYNGLYHVLGGNISPVNGIGPDNLNIASLIERIDTGMYKELILATNPTIEGETTALYLSKLLSNRNIIISRIAQGVPIGANLDYTDSVTLDRALEGRKIIK